MSAPRLSADSVLYRGAAASYARFAECEDAAGWVRDRLAPEIAGRIVLDLGCGSGKYARLLGPLAKSYIGLDAAAGVLKIARAAAGPRIAFMRGRGENIPLSDAGMDRVIATWVLGTIEDDARRTKALSECRRVLRPGGRLLLVENDCGGEFEILRGRCPNTGRTAAYNRWLEQNGLRAVSRAVSWFQFESVDEARAVFCRIYGQKAASQIGSPRIKHRLVLYAWDR